MKQFADYGPCIYMGAILCDDCSKLDCDMREWRIVRQKSYKAGYAQCLHELRSITNALHKSLEET